MGWRSRGLARARIRRPLARSHPRTAGPEGCRCRSSRALSSVYRDQLSLLALADQFADEGAPGGGNMFRVIGGNDRLPALLAKALADLASNFGPSFDA